MAGRLIVCAIVTFGVVTGTLDQQIPVTHASAPGRAYYLDCSSRAAGNGTKAHPWNRPAAVNSHEPFRPGDTISLRSGATCLGQLTPRGSGSARGYITIAAYGHGRQPLIRTAATSQAAIKLWNQEYWHIDRIATRGGLMGIYIGADKKGPRVLHHIWLSNDTVRGTTSAKHITTDPFANAMICVCGGYYTGATAFDPQFAGVLIDHVTAYNGLGDDGIFAGGDGVIIRNSTVHDVGVNGLWTGRSTHVLIENNVVHDVGGSPSMGGVVGIWTWACSYCVIQRNDVYNVTSAKPKDGGAFDIDYYSHHTVVQYNYAHDTDGYCVADIGSGDYYGSGRPNTDSIVRFNVCANTGLGPSHNPKFIPEGTFYVQTSFGGSIEGLQIYNNTVFANPASTVAVFQESTAKYSGRLPNLFENNLVYSTRPAIISAGTRSQMRFDHNLYFSPAHPTGAGTRWTLHGHTYTAFRTWQSGAGQDRHSLFANPHLPSPQYHQTPWPTTQLAPTPRSPAIRKGVNVCGQIQGSCSLGNRDFLSHKLKGDRLTIGAIQSS
jgi:hypothetical protein